MDMPYSRHGLEGRDKWLQRLFEIVPGALSWGTLLGLSALSFLQPTIAIICILAFDLYWLLFLFYTMCLLLASYFMLSTERHTDWLARARALPDVAPSPSAHTMRGRLSHWLHQRDVRALAESAQAPPAFDTIHHVVIIPTVTEGADVLGPGIDSLVAQDFPASRTIVVLALEERAAPRVTNDAWALHRKYADHFLAFYIAPHPEDTEGEAHVEGANMTYAARMATQVLQQKGIPEDNVVVTCLDADTILDSRYLSCLTYHFMVCPQRARAGFQPMPVYHSNTWNAASLSCVLDIGSSFFLLKEATDPEKLVSFSSYSMSFSALCATGFWPVDMVSHDSSIFWKAFLRFDGDYRVIPMYITLSMDVVQADSFWSTLTSVYRQKRRWAWGIENFPIVMRGFLRAPEIPLCAKLRHGFKMLHKHLTWSTWAFLLLVVGWLPGLVAAGGYHTSVAYHMAPRVQATIFRLAALSFVITVALSILHLPKPPSKYPILRWLRHIAAWWLLPLASTLLSVLPALDAQTRLMFGKDLAHNATEKARGKKVPSQ